MYKIIACDLDETLLGKDKKISPENKRAIQKARNLGVKFVPATGRGFTMMQDILVELDLHDKPDEYVISYNGAIITENKDNTILAFSGLSYDIAKELFAMGLTYDVLGVSLYTDTDKYMYRLYDDGKHLLTVPEAYVIEEHDLAFAESFAISKVLYELKNPLIFSQIHSELMAAFGNTISVSLSSNKYVEITRAGIDKGATLTKLAAILGIKHTEVLAIGDDLNDVSMLQVAGLGAAVANAAPQVKAIAQHISKRDHSQHAVAEIIEKFIL